MRQWILVCTVGLVLASACSAPAFADEPFVRGEVNDDGRVDFTDMISILVFVLLGGEAPACEDSGDVNDDGNLDISDAIFGLTFIILGGETPPPPGPFTPGFDGTPNDPYTCGDNTPPTSSFVAQPETGRVPLDVVFDAASSSDPEGEIVAYDWDFSDGDIATGPSVNHVYLSAGTYTATLTVTDDFGNTSMQSTPITVIPNQPPTAVASASPETTQSGLEITFDASASTDSGGTITAYRARFGQPEVGLGIIPGAGGTHRLTRLVGLGKARELIFTGEIVDGHEAYRIGLVERFAESDETMLETAQVLAKKIASNPLGAVRLAKLVLDPGERGRSLLGVLSQALCFDSDDKVARMTRFLDRKRPS
jgi:hypothetical protein